MLFNSEQMKLWWVPRLHPGNYLILLRSWATKMSNWEERLYNNGEIRTYLTVYNVMIVLLFLANELLGQDFHQHSLKRVKQIRFIYPLLPFFFCPLWIFAYLALVSSGFYPTFPRISWPYHFSSSLVIFAHLHVNTPVHIGFWLGEVSCNSRLAPVTWSIVSWVLLLLTSALVGIRHFA